MKAKNYGDTLLELTPTINQKGFDVQRATKLAQDVYNNDVSSLLSKGFSIICPDTYKEVLITKDFLFGTYTRDVYLFTDSKIVNLPIKLQRIILPCGVTHTLFPSCLIPYSQITYFGALAIHKFYNSEIYGDTRINLEIESKFGERINNLINNSCEQYAIICNLDSSTKISTTIFRLICADVIKFVEQFFNITKQVFLVNRKVVNKNTINTSFRLFKIIYCF